MKSSDTLNKAEWWAVFSAGNFAMRFGPFTGPEAGKAIERALKENIPMSLVGNCGKEIDWELIKEMEGLKSATTLCFDLGKDG